MKERMGVGGGDTDRTRGEEERALHERERVQTRRESTEQERESTGGWGHARDKRVVLATFDVSR